MLAQIRLYELAERESATDQDKDSKAKIVA